MLLIMPPGWDVAQPYLALPQLKGYLNKQGLDISIVDDSIDFFDFVLDKHFLNDKLESVVERYTQLDSNAIVNNLSEFNFLRRINIYRSKIKRVDEFKNTIRTTTDSELYHKCFRVISSCLDVLGAYYSMIFQPNYVESKVYNCKTLSGLQKFINDPESNIYLDYYLNGKGKELVERAAGETHIGLSITASHQFLSALTFLSILKKKKNAPILHLGGSYLTRLCKNASEEMLRTLLHYCDFLSLYEGEIILPLILTGSDYRDCPNVIYCDEDNIVRTEFQRYIPDTYVVPNFDGFSLDKYMTGRLALPLVTSKGCYSRCAFCTIPLSNSSSKYIPFDLKDVKAAIESLKEKYNTRYFTFNDETFNLKRMVEFSRLVKHDDIRWLCETRFDENISDSEVKEIVDSGCSYLQFGLESYNQRVLDLMNKNVRIENIDRIVGQCLKYGLPLHIFAFFGFPGETREEIKNTQDFILNTVQKFREAGLLKTSTGFGPYELEKNSPVYNHSDKFGIKILPNDADSISLTHRYTSDKVLLRDELDRIVDTFTANDPASYPNSCYPSFVLYSVISAEGALQPDFAEFSDHHDFDGKQADFSYIYNFNTQFVVPFDKLDLVAKEELCRIYCGNDPSELSENDHVRLNPLLVFDASVTDPIRELQFDLPDVYRPVVDSFQKDPVRQVPKDEMLRQLYDELYSVSIIIKTSA